MANSLDFVSSAQLLKDLHTYATGNGTISTPVNNSEFVAVADVTLKTGVDNVIKALSQVLTKTIFPNRPYNSTFKILYKDSQAWGNHVRKINFIDDPPMDDPTGASTGKEITKGTAVSPYVWQPTDAVQTNFYGANKYSRMITITEHQLKNAFRNADEFGSFVSSLILQLNNLIEQDKDVLARTTITNFIAGKNAKDATNVIKLVSEFKAFISNATPTFTFATIVSLGKLEDFFKFATARIKTISNLMQERSTKFCQTITGKPIARFTPKSAQRAIFLNENIERMNAFALSSIFNEEYLKTIPHEKITYWQDINNPAKIDCTPAVMSAAGVFEKGTRVTMNNVFGILYDDDAIGANLYDSVIMSTPMNSRALFSNTYAHYTLRHYNDFTENAVVFTLD